MQQSTDSHYLTLRQTALAVIRNSGHCTRGDLAGALDLSAVAVADLIEDILTAGLVRRGLYESSRQLTLTTAGAEEVGLVRLAQNGRDRIYRRWTANDPDGRKRAA